MPQVTTAIRPVAGDAAFADFAPCIAIMKFSPPGSNLSGLAVVI
jgi:hypothetical protein